MSTRNVLLAQPQGMVSLFFVGLWERFGFYAVQAMLVIYLTKALGFSDDIAYDTFSATVAFIYASPFIGGYIADKWLGYRHSILLGAVILTLGYWLLMVPTRPSFYWALALLIIGNGFFKGCISTLLGTLYTINDPRRNSGYTIFYMGINIGAFIGPVLSGLVVESLGWPFVFGFAGCGLVLAIIVALITFKSLGNNGLAPLENRMRFGSKRVKPLLPILLGCLVVSVLLSRVIHSPQIANLLYTLSVLSSVVMVFFIALRLQGRERANMVVLIVLLLFSILFWAIYTQIYSSLTLFIDRVIDRQVVGYTIPSSMFLSCNAFFIIALTPFFVWFWNRLAMRHSVFASPSIQFTMALTGMALGYLVLVFGIHNHDATGHVPVAWLVLSYFFQTTGELMLSPIGLSIVSVLAPEKYRSMMMGGWFLSLSAGFSLSGYLAKFTSIPIDVLTEKSTLAMLPYYEHAFSQFFALTAAVAVLLLCLAPLMNRATYDDKRLADMPT